MDKIIEEYPLPDPWVRDGAVDYDYAATLENIVGSGLTEKDLGPEDGYIDGHWQYPRTPKGWQVAGARWVRIRNVNTGERVLLRLQDGPESNIAITSLIVPHRGVRALTGADLRDIPVAALSAAFTANEVRRNAPIRRKTILINDYPLPDPLAPLPDAERSDTFLALVARQYEALEQDGQRPTIAAMAALNGRPESTVRRWVSQARKARLLAPAIPVRGERD